MAGTLRDLLLPVVDSLRKLPTVFGIRRYSVTLRTRTWTGAYPGEGGTPPTVVNLPIIPAPRVTILSTAEVASSGGTYRDGDYRITAITPAYTPSLSGGTVSGGYTLTQLNIRPTSKQQDVAIILVGDDGIAVEAEAVEFRQVKPFRYELIARLISPPTRG